MPFGNSFGRKQSSWLHYCEIGFRKLKREGLHYIPRTVVLKLILPPKKVLISNLLKRIDLVQLMFVTESCWSQATVKVNDWQGGKDKCAQHARAPHSPAVLTLKRRKATI